MPFPYPWQGVRDPLAVPSGAMRSWVEIQQQGPGRDAAGGPANQWATVWSTMSAIATLSQSEVYEPGQIVGRVSHRVTVRWPGASVPILEGMRVLFDGRTFRIQAVDNVQERNRVLHLLCLEIDGSQQ
jgi:SPP1 family predicted phage head-tail adaptor